MSEKPFNIIYESKLETSRENCVKPLLFQSKYENVVHRPVSKQRDKGKEQVHVKISETSNHKNYTSTL